MSVSRPEQSQSDSLPTQLIGTESDGPVQTDKRRSIGLGDVSYSYAATDIGSQGGSHIKTITVIKNVKIPKHGSDADSKEFKPDDWVKHVDTEFKILHNFPEIPAIPAFNYLPIDVGNKKPPVVATLAPPKEEEPVKGGESDVGSKDEPGSANDESEAGTSDAGRDAIEGKIIDEAETLNEDADIGFERQAKHDVTHMFKMHRPPTQQIEALPQAMSLVHTKKQPTGIAASDDLEFIRLGPHSIRTEDAVRSKAAQSAWNRKKTPQQKQTDVNNEQHLANKMVQQSTSDDKSQQTKYDALINDFSDFSMHNVKHIIDPISARKKPLSIHYTIDFNASNPANRMPSPLSHQTQQSLDQGFSVKHKNLEASQYNNQQLQESFEQQENKPSSKLEREMNDDGSIQWSAYSDSDRGNIETDLIDNSNSERQQFGLLQQKEKNTSANSKFKSSVSTENEKDTNEKRNSGRLQITLQNANIRATNEFVAYETTRHGKFVQTAQSPQNQSDPYRNGKSITSNEKAVADQLVQIEKGDDDYSEQSEQQEQAGGIAAYSNSPTLSPYKVAQNKTKLQNFTINKQSQQSPINAKEKSNKQQVHRKPLNKEPEQLNSDSESYASYQQANNALKPKAYAAPSIQKMYTTSSTTTQRMPYLAPIKSRAPMQFYIINAPTTSTQRPYLSPSVYKSYSLNLEQTQRDQDKLATERELLEQQQQHEERLQLQQLQSQRSQALRIVEDEEEKPHAEKLQQSRDPEAHTQLQDNSESYPLHFDHHRFYNPTSQPSNKYRIPEDVEVFSEMTPMKSQSYRTATHEELRVTSARPRDRSVTAAPSVRFQGHSTTTKHARSRGNAPESVTSNHNRQRFLAVPLDVSTPSPYVADPKLRGRKVPAHLVRHPLVFDSRPPHSFLDSPFRLSLKPSGSELELAEFSASGGDEP